MVRQLSRRQSFASTSMATRCSAGRSRAGRHRALARQGCKEAQARAAGRQGHAQGEAGGGCRHGLRLWHASGLSTLGTWTRAETVCQWGRQKKLLGLCSESAASCGSLRTSGEVLINTDSDIATSRDSDSVAGPVTGTSLTLLLCVPVCESQPAAQAASGGH